MTSLVWTAISLSPCSSKVFPSSLNSETTDKKSFLKVVCELGVCSWCPRVLDEGTTFSNPLIIWTTSGPETIHHLRAAGFSVKPTAPQSPLLDSFSCSWAWSSAMAENGRFVLCNEWPTAKLLKDIGMFYWKLAHITDVDWQPPRVVNVVQSKHPGYNLCQCFNVQCEVRFSYCPHKLLTTQFKVQQSWPVEKWRTLFWRNVEIHNILLSQTSTNHLNSQHRSMLCLSLNLIQSPDKTFYMPKPKFQSLNL